MRQFFAHSTGAIDKHDWQPLPEHARGVAELAASFGVRFGLDRAARLAGLLHDLGKYNPAFQVYIESEGKSLDGLRS